ncbi:Regulatory protein AsnC [Klebsiella pneumoniae subsp. ozaenae]|uniref:Regulatory protein AsnC n=1 Tax=Klebsiella pneumoniae subsp. ozaenae TaxID=574 RepID=A0A378ARI9_KLEPO|nr:Regulatory protein AsnC [Klebsiella pneumoniae subsp. ozaenae]
MENYQIDNLDRGILDALMANARTAYAELAKQFSVSPGTIHVRVEKMKQAGIITGARIDVSPKQLGYDVGLLHRHYFKKRQRLSLRPSPAWKVWEEVTGGLLHHRPLQHLLLR